MRANAMAKWLAAVRNLTNFCVHELIKNKKIINNNNLMLKFVLISGPQHGKSDVFERVIPMWGSRPSNQTIC